LMRVHAETCHVCSDMGMSGVEKSSFVLVILILWSVKPADGSG
jgi:hypothetical protein